MRIIELERRTQNGGGEIGADALKYNAEDYRDWWCVIETEAEEMVYEDYLEHLGGYADPREVLWNKMMIQAGRQQGLAWGDDDVFGYLRPGEDVPEVGEEMVDSEGDVWVRLA